MKRSKQFKKKETKKHCFLCFGVQRCLFPVEKGLYSNNTAKNIHMKVVVFYEITHQRSRIYF